MGSFQASGPIPLPFLVFGEAVLAILEFFQGVPLQKPADSPGLAQATFFLVGLGSQKPGTIVIRVSHGRPGHQGDRRCGQNFRQT